MSYVVTIAGERRTPYGKNPSGYLSYSADGRMQVIAAPNRRMVAGAVPGDNEKVALFDTMFAYAGTYTVHADAVIHHVDVSWNDSWTSTDQIRRFEVSGNALTLTTRITDPASGTAKWRVSSPSISRITSRRPFWLIHCHFLPRSWKHSSHRGEHDDPPRRAYSCQFNAGHT